MRYTQTTLKKLEDIFDELDYSVRYEKGNFQSGYCLVENRRVAVISKFFDTEGRINTLLDILSKFEIDQDALSEKSKELLQKWEKEQAD
jgi:stage III sporulation protein SpoIIIAA